MRSARRGRKTLRGSFAGELGMSKKLKILGLYIKGLEGRTSRGRYGLRKRGGTRERYRKPQCGIWEKIGEGFKLKGG